MSQKQNGIFMDFSMDFLTYWIGTQVMYGPSRHSTTEQTGIKSYAHPTRRKRCRCQAQIKRIHGAGKKTEKDICSNIYFVTPTSRESKSASSVAKIHGSDACFLSRVEMKFAGFVLLLQRGIGLYVVAINFFLLLLNCSAWPCMAVA